MGEKVGISFDFELDEDEKILQATPHICDVEFDKQEDFFQTIVGSKVKGRVCAKPYLTNKRILMWLLLVPFEVLEPKMIWYTLPFENIHYMRPGKAGKVGKKQLKKKGLEMEFATPKVGGVASSIGKRMIERGGVTGWLGGKIGKEKTKVWLYIPDFPVWNMAITKILQEKNLI